MIMYSGKDIVKAPVFAISRLRMGTDGSGITTLVTFMGCPLRCKYCLNRKCHEPIYETDGKTLREGIMLITPQELYDLVKVDDIYFQSTGGGICFGGGEPTLYPQFIEEFKKLCGNQWKITLETCGRCSYNTIKELSNVVDYWIVDIKSMNSSIYREYTGMMSGVRQHLESIKMHIPNDRVAIKVPHIPGFNDEEDLDSDIKDIKEEFGFTHICKIKYKKVQQENVIMNKGKQKCEVLKRIRQDIADRYGLEYTPSECNNQRDCSGTCPRCDAELEELQRKLESRGISDIELTDIGIETTDNDDIHTLEGDVAIPSGNDLMTVTVGMPAPPFRNRAKKKVLYKECQIAGITFHDLKDVWDELYEGAELALVREKDNKHDKYAIAVALADDYDGDPDDFDFDFILGYVPRSENKHLATMLDLGWAEAFECELSQVNGSNPYKGSLYMKIYMVSKDEEEIEEPEHLLPVLEFDDRQIELFKSSLESKGFSCQRWGALLPGVHNLPNEGDKLVILHRNKKNSELYLTHIIAKDKNADFFVKDEERCVDDCVWFVLTNVVGPVLVSNDDIKFLDNEPINKVHPEEYVSLEATDELYALIYSQEADSKSKLSEPM